MTEPAQIPDQAAREAAATTFDRNVVVIAGAGTGKTTLLVNRFLYLLMRRTDPLDLSRIVALTFTNKAATEMKLRLRERLRSLVNVEGRDNPAAGSGTVSIADLCMRYGWTTDEIVARADAALRDVEKAQIGTLHSFAAHLLRLYPIEAGVTPTFQTDEDGSRFEEHFTSEWELWLDGELGAAGSDHGRWRILLDTFSLDELRELAYSLHSDLIDLNGLMQQVAGTGLNKGLRDWFSLRKAQAERLLARYDRPKRRKIELMLAAAADLFALLLAEGLGAVRRNCWPKISAPPRPVGRKTTTRRSSHCSGSSNGCSGSIMNYCRIFWPCSRPSCSQCESRSWIPAGSPSTAWSARPGPCFAIIRPSVSS